MVSLSGFKCQVDTERELPHHFPPPHTISFNYVSVSVCGYLYMREGTLGGQRHKISLELELQVVSHQHEFWELNPRPLARAVLALNSSRPFPFSYPPLFPSLSTCSWQFLFDLSQPPVCWTTSPRNTLCSPGTAQW